MHAHARVSLAAAFHVSCRHMHGELGWLGGGGGATAMSTCMTYNIDLVFINPPIKFQNIRELII